MMRIGDIWVDGGKIQIVRNSLAFAIDGYFVALYATCTLTDDSESVVWAAVPSPYLPSSLQTVVLRTIDLLNQHRKNPAVQMWLSSGQYGGMTLEEFLESING